jgi:DNA replication protein DnaC
MILDSDLKMVQERKRAELGFHTGGPAEDRGPQQVTATCAGCKGQFTTTILPHLGLPPRVLCSCCEKAKQREEAADRARIRQEAERREKELAEAEERRVIEAREAALAAIRADLPAALRQCGVPLHWQQASFEGCVDLPSELVAAARGWSAEPRGMLYFFGPPGAGKTYLAVSILRAMLEAGLYIESTPLAAFDLRCGYICERDFLAELRAEFDRGMTYPADVQAMSLLVFDDLGSGRLTDWGRGEVAGLLEHRHAQELPTLVTSNLSPDELAVAVDPRVSSRIVESKLVFRFPPRDLRITGTLRRTAAAENGGGG